MSLSQVVPGRYTASIRDWGLEEKQINGDDAIEAWISFDFKDQAGGMQSITWKSLVLKRDGTRNKKTFDTLETCGMKPDPDTGEINLVRFMDADALNMQEPLDITIIDQPSKDGTKIYKNVEWVNKVGGGQRNKPTGEAKLSLEQKLIAQGLGKAKARPKNHAPGASSPGANDNPEIPF
jgi:hypothetical protein